VSTIVVGVDGSDGARDALRFALEEARLRGARVHVVAAWQVPVAAYGGALVSPDSALVDQLAAEARSAVERALAGAGDLAADADVDIVVREGAPAQVLLEESDDADLLVLGSRGLGGFRSLLLGSVSQHCAHHAPCPVVIVRHPRQL
jgi:nucleotide-binding universal stress UspA family protein